MLGYTNFLDSKYQGVINISKYKYISMSRLSPFSETKINYLKLPNRSGNWPINLTPWINNPVLSGTKTSLVKLSVLSLLSIPTVITAGRVNEQVGKALRVKNFDILMTSSHHKFCTISFKSSVSAELITFSALMPLEFSFDLQYHKYQFHQVNIWLIKAISLYCCSGLWKFQESLLKM